LTRPLVGVAASHHLAEDTYEVQMTGRRTIDAVGQVAGCLPMLIPGLPDAVGIGDLLATLDGIVLTGARANVHPMHYGEPYTEAHGLTDEGRDAVILPLVRAALDRGVPVFGLCKGIQEMNVALGGTLWPEVGALPGRHRHRMPKGCRDPEIVFEPRERVRLRPGGEVARIVGVDSIVTNSLHGQAIREPGRRVVLEGWAADETIEAISIEGARSFAIGVQWHAEYDVDRDPVSLALFHAFGAAARARQAGRRSAAARAQPVGG
jgi:putative glutamine amidotransferase